MTAATSSPLAHISTENHHANFHRSPSSSSSSSTISSSASSRSPSPPLHAHKPLVSSPLSSPSISTNNPSGSSYFPSSTSPTTPSSPLTPTSSLTSPPSPGVAGPRRASQPSLFPRSQPLRPMVAMTSINKPTMGLGISTNGGGRRKSAAELEEEKYKTPINGTGGARKAGNIGGGSKKGGVKLLVSKRMQTTFVLDMNCQELSRAEST